MHLPKQLQREDFNFIKLKGKDPKINGKGWQKQIHRFGEAEALLEKHQNYGVMGGHGGLVILDADSDAVSEAVEKNLPETFTVMSGSGKKHYYFICPEIEKKIVFDDNIKPSLFKGKEDHYGEIISKGGQAVGPGSIHPETKNFYEVFKDLPITEITKEKLLKGVFDFLPKVHEDVIYQKGTSDRGSKELSTLKITDIINVKKTSVIVHPFHGAKNGGNLSIDVDKNSWYCFRCETGGGPLTLIAVMEGIIDCAEAGRGAGRCGLKGDKFKRTLDIAEAKYGLKRNLPTALVMPDSEIEFLTHIGRSGEPIVVQNTENICRVLRHHKIYRNNLRFDSFKNVYEMFQNKRWRTIEDNDAVVIQTEISILYPFFMKVGKDMVYDALIKVSKENTIDSAIGFIKSIKWDNVSRLDTWLSVVYGTPEDVYHKAVASNWIKGLVSRIVNPGCKFDYVLVLEGEQGSKKSSSLYTLGGDWHVETAMSTDSKDFFMQFAGKAIVEFSEGETLSRTEVKRMKAIITMQVDKYRPPYSRVSQDFPRRCVFAMTTNQTEYLKDETGNRRWLPVKLMSSEANIEWLEKNREQLFAEAYHRVFNLKEKIYEFPKEETLKEQEARRMSSPQSDLIIDWYFSNTLSNYDKKYKGITTNQVYRQAICGGMVTKPMEKFMEMAISDILKNTLKLTRKRIQQNGMQSWRWMDEKLPEMPEEEVDAMKKLEVSTLWQ